MKIQRAALKPARTHADSGIVATYPLERAAWVWHPDAAVDEIAVLRFSCTVQPDEPTATRLHVSADQRYELFIDGRRIGMGPDRAELNHWAFASYDVQLDAGPHTVEARVWWLGDFKPVAQVTCRGGFILAAEALESQLNTGDGPWRVRRETGWAFTTSSVEGYHVIGPTETFDADADAEPVVDATVVRRARLAAPGERHTGIIDGPYHLHPSPLPDMMFQSRHVGRVRAVIEGDPAGPVPAAACDSPAIARWQPLIDGEGSVDIPADADVSVIVDLQDYYCGFTEIHATGGAGATVEIEWAESLYNLDGDGKRSPHKGNRGDVAGKRWYGFGHRMITGVGTSRYRSLWWTSGRFHRIRVTTADQPITLQRAGLIETRYPYDDESHWRCDHADHDALLPIAVRGIQMCSHETYLDCPYYEQMMYVGDTRVQMLVARIMSADDRLTKRGIELFDWSRWKTGYIAERCPSQPYQLSLTFSTIWVYMIRDHMMWRGDRRWVAQRLTGIRNLIDNVLPLRNADGLLENLPGWSFVDWVPEWPAGIAPDGLTGVSSIINLQFVYALRGAEAIERCCGEAALADRYGNLADRIGRAVVERFWHGPSNRLADDLAHEHFSEHAQALAILCDVLDETQTTAALNALEQHDDLARTTVYYSFYLLDAFAKLGRGDLIENRLACWQTLRELDMKTPVEKPEPSRSDCHAWGSHPMYHLHASLAGIRPDSPGFESVIIRPSPGSLREIDSDIPHPRGRIKTQLCFDEQGGCEAAVHLPDGVAGRLVWAGREHPLVAGANTVGA